MADNGIIPYQPNLWNTANWLIPEHVSVDEKVGEGMKSLFG